MMTWLSSNIFSLNDKLIVNIIYCTRLPDLFVFRFDMCDEYLSRKPREHRSLGFPTRSNTNWPVQQTEEARNLKIWI